MTEFITAKRSCKHCGDTRRYAHYGCPTCAKERKEKRNAQQRSLRAENPEKYRKRDRARTAKRREIISEQERNRRAKYPEKFRRQRQTWEQQNPGYCVDQRDRERARTARRRGHAPPPLERDCPRRTLWCWCCGQDADPNNLHMDHLHDVYNTPENPTANFRGWNHNKCNTGAGAFDDPDLLQNRIEQLRFKLPWQ
jgi:hypothetical protein